MLPRLSKIEQQHCFLKLSLQRGFFSQNRPFICRRQFLERRTTFWRQSKKAFSTGKIRLVEISISPAYSSQGRGSSRSDPFSPKKMSGSKKRVSISCVKLAVSISRQENTANTLVIGTFFLTFRISKRPGMYSWMSSCTRSGQNAMSLMRHRSARSLLVLRSNLAMRYRKSLTFLMLSSKTCSAGSSIKAKRDKVWREEGLTCWDHNLVFL